MRFEFKVEGLTRRTLKRWRRLARPSGMSYATPAWFIAGAMAIYTVAPPEGAGVTTLLSGNCKGTITTRPARGYAGEPQIVTITIQPPFHRAIARVITDNPACRQCEAVRRGPGRYVFSGHFVGEGLFRIQFLAHDRGGNVRCHGFTAELRAMGPRP